MNRQTTTEAHCGFLRTFGGACPKGQRADATLEVGSCIVNRRSVYYICDGADSVNFSQTHYMYFSPIITVLKLQIHPYLEAFPYCNTTAYTWSILGAILPPSGQILKMRFII